MDCENCHKEKATEVVMKPDGFGGETEAFVCKACAAKMKKTADAEADDDEDGDEEESGLHVVNGNAENAPPFVKNLLDATLGFIKGVSEVEKKAKEKCPSCGRTLVQIGEDDSLGCAECWKTFGDEIRGHYLEAQYGRTHVGPPPLSSERAITRASIERRLKAAIDQQDFRKAAAIKDELDAFLAGGKENPA